MVVDDAQNAEPTPILKAVADKIQRPAFVGNGRYRQRCPSANCRLATATLPDLQAFFLVQAPKPLVVEVIALPLQKDMQPPVAKSPSFTAQFLQAFADAPVVWSTGPVTNHTSVGTDNSARPPLAHLKMIPKVNDRFALHSGRPHFF